MSLLAHICKSARLRLTRRPLKVPVAMGSFLHVCASIRYLAKIIRLILNPKVTQHERGRDELCYYKKEDARRANLRVTKNIPAHETNY